MTTELAHRTMVALSPLDLPKAQSEIAAWCHAKIIDLSHELRDARQNLRQAKAMLWRYHGWQAVIRKTTARMLYYVKIKAAVQAGYLIVPNFPVDVFAVRVSRQSPKDESREPGSWGTPSIQVTPEFLPPGDGRYVGPEAKLANTSYHEQKDGKQQLVRRFSADGFVEDIDFPVKAVKPVVLNAAQRALATRIFDSVGVVTNGGAGGFVQRRGDPIVVGRILDPRGNGRMVTFFVAWWLDTRAL